MQVEPLASVEVWPIRQVEYTTAHGDVRYGIYISSCRRNGEEMNYIITAEGQSIVLPASRVKRLPETTRVSITINV